MNIQRCPKCQSEIKPGAQVCPVDGYVFPFATDMLDAGRVLQNRYELVKLIHSGGMGYIYLAQDKHLDREVVVKQVRQPVKSDAHRKKLEEEALRMAQLSHPAVAMVFKHFVEDDFYFLVMEYINGQTLSEIFEKSGRKLEESKVINWIVQVCEVIGYLHNKGMVHRDISPDNIMLTEEGHIKLIDFGTLHDLGLLSGKKAGKEGKFGFTPKEQWDGNPVPQSDVFAIGATTYYLLTGFLPVSEVCQSGGKPQPSDYSPEFPPIRNSYPEISNDLEVVLVKALQPDIADRYSSIELFKQAILKRTSYVEKPDILKPITQSPAAGKPAWSGKVTARPVLFWSGVALLVVGLLGWLFLMVLTCNVVNPEFSAEIMAVRIPLLSVLLLPLLIPGLILLRRGSLLKPDSITDRGYIPQWWWAIPAMLGLIGGFISWRKNRDIDRRKAMNMLTLGIIISVIWPSMITSANLLFNKLLVPDLSAAPWAMFRHDLQHTGRSPYVGSQVNTVKWSYPTGDLVLSSPAIGSDGTVYVGSSDKKLYAINPDGSLKWSYTTGDEIYSSPAIGSDGTVYVGSYDGKLYAINPDGSLKWSFHTGDCVSSSPAIGNDGTVYVGSLDMKLYAINPDGSLKWSYPIKWDPFTGNVSSSPAIGKDGTVYVGSYDEKLYAINPDGSLKWSFPTGFWVMSSPAIGSDDTVYVGSCDEKLYAINPDGSLKWSYTTGGWIHATPAIGSDGTVYVGSDDNNLYAINADGGLKWSFPTGESIRSSPAIGSDGTLYVGSYDEKLYAINPDGSLKWSYPTGDSIFSSPAIGSDGTVYVGSLDGKLYAFH
jgi:outer membrane protein assembly factor BamB/serine/threonine protein kinase